ASPNAKGGLWDETPMHLAASAGNIEALQQLFLAGGDIGAKDSRGFFPLYDAAQSGQIEAVNWLIQHGADTLATTNGREGALAPAARDGHGKIVKILLATPGGPLQTSDALYGAADYDRIEIVNDLLAAGANPDGPMDGRPPPLVGAAYDGRIKICNAL